MTMLASDEQVGLDHAGPRTFNPGDVVHAMAVRAGGGEHGRLQALGTMQRRGHPMKIGEVGGQHLSGNSIFRHQFLVRMTVRAKLGNAQVRGGRQRVGVVVRAVTVGAYRDVGVALGQGVAVSASCVCGADRHVALRAGRGDLLARPRGRSHRVRAVAVDAGRRFLLAFGQSRVMNAVKQPGVLGEVAFFARLVIGQRHRAPVLELPRRVRHRGNVGVTVGTSELAAVNRMGEALPIDV